jgi:tRNA pseudouridine38-40 synthase
MRIKAIIAYDGTAFEGFQRQTRTTNTVTTALENALHSLGIESPVTGSGRTDAGVHATGQVIHLDLPPLWTDMAKLRTHLNGRLYRIQIKHITPVSDDFHARFDAKRRTYRYLFSDRTLSVFEQPYIAQVGSLDLSLLEEALKCFEGKHDFGYFMKTGSETRDTLRTVIRTRLKQWGGYHVLYFEADGFLRAQVRMMLHAAFAVAQGTMITEQLRQQLECAHRHTTRLAPPEGLYLARVVYPS